MYGCVIIGLYLYSIEPVLFCFFLARDWENLINLTNDFPSYDLMQKFLQPHCFVAEEVNLNQLTQKPIDEYRLKPLPEKSLVL